MNRYEGPDSHLPKHSDDELSIDPESAIYTLSLGQDRTVTFEDKFSKNTQSLVAQARSLYTMTRSSQDYYTHEIMKEPNTKLRYSFTFRNVGPEFLRSTLLIGDSNSKFLSFGVGKGTFGKALPGKRVKAARIEDINPYDCAGYANVVVLAGTNNLWPKHISDRTDITKIVDDMQSKIDVIRRFRKNIKIVLLPVLHTRLAGMNRQIHCYNNMIFDRFISSGHYYNVNMPSLREFVDQEYLLNTDFLRNKPNDAVHLNSFGLSTLAQIIKSQIIKGYRRKSEGGPKRSASKAGSGWVRKTS